MCAPVQLNLGYISESDDQEVVSYKSPELSMTQFRLFVSDLVHQGQDLLTQLFLLHSDEQCEAVPHLRLIRIKDNAAENYKGQSFFQDSPNEQELHDGPHISLGLPRAFLGLHTKIPT